MAETIPFLEETRVRKAREVAARRRVVSSEALLDQAEPAQRSLRAHLARPGARFVLEHKRQAPSAGILAEARPLAETVAAFRGIADGISVLADAAFRGSLDDVAEARACTDLPILCKDFVLGPDQVVEARVHGADAALVLLSLLDDDEARACLQTGERLGMDVLVETHDEREVQRAVALGAPLIGINNRDLRTLTVDLRTTERLAPLVPSDRTLVAESGVACAEDIHRLAPGVDAFLIGSAVMGAPNPFDAARALTLGRVKVCGLTRPEDAELALEAGARFGGVVLAESPRRASPAQVLAISERCPDLPLVGVFRDQGLDEMLALADGLPLVAYQLHGSSRSSASALREWLPADIEVWIAAGVDRAGQIDDAFASHADRLVFDRALAGKTGGTGVAFDWSVLPKGQRSAGLLAGGLSPANAAEAKAVGAYSLDISSKIEVGPGHKDPALLQAFFDQLRPPCRQTLEVSRAA